MNIEQLIDSLRFRFGASGVDNARRVAEELTAHLLNCKPLEIYTKRDIQPKNEVEQLCLIKQIEPLAKRIENGEPLQYVVGHVDFFGLQIKCDRRALIPRPETEWLVDEVLCSPIWEHKPTSVIDVGTGSGCIALTLAKQHPDANLIAVDLSAEALELAQENAQLNDLKDRVLCVKTICSKALQRTAPTPWSPIFLISRRATTKCSRRRCATTNRRRRSKVRPPEWN